ncbi:Protein FRIGIDA [Apostasia shenzhenica]|uniref:FRIGIDA-like protein n=1 Tax=Apostasia shenzhenica TaxID=1088818 RepID=A0A2I0AW27_9ASPA|nr:Protein FRIGIDA [Apostasia shenzhenica]
MPAPSAVEAGFAELERQRELISSCTALWKELNDHFSSLERGLELRSECLRSRRLTLDLSTQRKLASLHRREESIDGTVGLAIARVEELHSAALTALSSAGAADLPSRIRDICRKMDYDAFFDFVASSRKECDLLRKEIPLALGECIDPATFTMDTISKVFPMDRRAVKSQLGDLGWVTVLVLESLVPVLTDPKLGTDRLLVTRTVKERAMEMAEVWKESMEQRGGLESVKAQDAHAFLQLLVTFGIGAKEEREFYRKLVVSFSWRKQMPKLAIALGLDDKMNDIIEELISKRQQLDAINFAYESGLQDKYPAVPLLKSFLKDAKKAASVISEERNNSGPPMNNNNRKEQYAIRAVMRCIEEHKLESEFPLENLHKRLENLEKAKSEKRKTSSGPANKRTRASNGGPMPPAKAGRLTGNAYVSSFPVTAAPTFLRSASPTAYPAAPFSPFSPYPYERQAGHGFYSNHCPPALRDPYAYPAEEVVSAPIAASYPSPPMSYPSYGCYSSSVGAYSNGIPTGYQQAYYR